MEVMARRHKETKSWEEDIENVAPYKDQAKGLKIQVQSDCQNWGSKQGCQIWQTVIQDAQLIWISE